MNTLLPALVYASAAVFLAGMGWRLFTWLRAPVPLKIVLTPGPTTSAGVAHRLAGEALLFRSLFGADRSLWVAAWIFHLSLVLLALGKASGDVSDTSIGISASSMELSLASESTNATIVEMAANVQQINQSMDELLMVVEGITSAIRDFDVAIKNVGKNVDHLANHAEHTKEFAEKKITAKGQRRATTYYPV